MTAPKFSLLTAGIVIAAALTVSGWQQTRIHRLAAENTQLRTATPETPVPRQAVETSPTPPDLAEQQRLQAEHEQLMTEVLQLRAAVAAATEKKARSRSNSDDRAARTEQAARYQFNLLTNRIDLTPEQQEKIFPIIKKAIEARQIPRTGPPGPDRAWKTQSEKDAETEISALLSPEQQAAYDKFREDEAVMTARSMGSSELGGMQREVGLTEAQQDQVFQVFYNLTRRMMEGETMGTEKLINALSDVLTARQIDLYRAYLSPTNSRGFTTLTSQ